MIREIAYILIATAAAAALWLVLLLAWHELGHRAGARRYRAQVSANRLAIRQEERAQRARLMAELDRRFGQEPLRAPNPPVKIYLSPSVMTDVASEQFREAVRHAGT